MNRSCTSTTPQRLNSKRSDEMSLRFHPAVKEDINVVLGYYSERSATVADRFWDALQKRNPLRGLFRR